MATLFDERELGDGKVTWASEYFDREKPAREQGLGHEMLLVSYAGGISMEVGWLPGESEFGCFEIHLIAPKRNVHWPVFMKWRCGTYEELRRVVKEVVVMIPRLRRGRVPVDQGKVVDLLEGVFEE